jgi:hypothetical protein
MFECNICNFTTDKSCNLSRHKKTKKHLINEAKWSNNDINNYFDNNSVISESHFRVISESHSDFTDNENKQNKANGNKFKCNVCKKLFSDKSNMYRHRKKHETVKHENFLNNNETIQFEDNEKNQLIKKNIEIEELKKQNEQLLKLANKNADTANKNADTANVATKTNSDTMNMMSYAINNLQDAPSMKPLRNDKILKMLNNNNTSKNFTTEDVILLRFDDNMLHQYIGDLILSHYKKKNPKDQSTWSTDVSRSNFIIKCAVKGSKKSEWIKDKSGLQIKKMVITPIVTKIKNMIMEYCEKFKQHILYTNVCIEDKREYMGKMDRCNELIRKILKKKIYSKILRYISPHFDFKVDEEDTDSDNDSDSDDPISFHTTK